MKNHKRLIVKLLISLFVIFLAIIGFYFYSKTKQSFGTLLRICPNEKISNQMSSIDSGNDLQSKYFILDGRRRELSEFDLDW